MRSSYSDIIHPPHHVSKVHPQITMAPRAAQFSPFAALVGYEDVVHEMERQTAPERELNEDEKVELDRRIAIVAAHLAEHPVVTIEYFVPDERKDGGEYVFKSGTVEKIVSAERMVVVGGETILASGVLITGCCHAGIINTGEACRRACPNIAIRTIIGGLHLRHASKDRLERTASYLASLELERLVLMHCTGENAVEYL